MSDKQIEKEIQEKNLNAPRITPDRIDEVIVNKHFFTAADGAYSTDYASASNTPLHLLTFCVLELKNGFTVTGESACASPENFDAEIGNKIAFENAKSKVWMLEGYLLKQSLHDLEIS